ncbi:MFS family permease [Sphingosinicella soli]|uniref:MFS family permease n=2 Tax=Sphingosinicella soli TaxID=333708 RepID=A0A7W7AZK7_9SPHN|nr:MFS family permease [Sphingosinicella soli]
MMIDQNRPIARNISDEPTGIGSQSGFEPAFQTGETAADWGLVLVCTVGLTVSMIYLYALGPFIVPVSEEMGWSRGETSAGLTLISLASVIAAPFVGFWVDRFGSRRIAIIGCMVFCFGISLLSSAGSHISWLLIWAIVAMGSVMMKPTVWMSAVAHRIHRRRGLAMGVALTGTGISSALSPIVAGEVISSSGWRTAFLVLGTGAALLLLPLLLLFFRDRPIHSRGTDKRNAAEGLVGLTISEGLRSAVFIRLALAGFLINFSVMGLVVHFVPLLEGQHFQMGEATALASLIGVTTIVARLVTGNLLDRFHAPTVAAIAFSLPIYACLMLLFFDGSTIMAATIAILIGAAVGAEVDALAYLSSRYFGMRSFGTLFGSITGAISLGIGLGPTSAGAIHDAFGTYQPMFLLIIPLVAVSVVLVATLGAYPDETAQR